MVNIYISTTGFPIICTRTIYIYVYTHIINHPFWRYPFKRLKETINPWENPHSSSQRSSSPDRSALRELLQKVNTSRSVAW